MGRAKGLNDDFFSAVLPSRRGLSQAQAEFSTAPSPEAEFPVETLAKSLFGDSSEEAQIDQRLALAYWLLQEGKQSTEEIVQRSHIYDVDANYWVQDDLFFLEKLGLTTVTHVSDSLPSDTWSIIPLRDWSQALHQEYSEWMQTKQAKLKRDSVAFADDYQAAYRRMGLVQWLFDNPLRINRPRSVSSIAKQSGLYDEKMSMISLSPTRDKVCQADLEALRDMGICTSGTHLDGLRGTLSTVFGKMWKDAYHIEYWKKSDQEVFRLWRKLGCPAH